MSQAFVLSGKITLDPAAAVAGLDATTAALAETKAAVEGVGRAGSGSAGMAKLTQQASALEAAMGRGSMGGRGYQGAAGAVGNLTAQFNDIGVMMMAGQNPLQLAIQQGTQISQVIGPMGASGAAKALGTAFMGMLNPVSLLTMGTIGLGAALVHWLTAGEDEARGLEDVLGDLDKSIKALRDGTRRTLEDLRADFGALTPEVLDMERAFQELRIREVLLDAAEAATTLRAKITDGWSFGSGTVADQIDKLFPQIDGSRISDQLSALGNTGDIAEMASIVNSIRVELEHAGGGIAGMNKEQAEYYAQVLQTLEKLRLAAAATDDIAATDISGGIRAAADEARRLANELLAAVGAAQSLALQGQTALREAQLKFEFKDNPVKLAGELAALHFNAATNGASPSSPEGVGIRILRDEAVAAAVGVAELDQAYAEWQRNQRSAAGGGGTAKEGSALADLIDAQLQELAVLRETDPVQRELLKHREALAGATDTERQVVEELIATRLREQELQTTQDFFTGTLYDAFEGLILEGNSLNDVLDNIVWALARAALQATLLGEGPLAGLFGTSGGGGLLTMLAGAIIPGKAGGGMITGPGSGTSDDVLIAASSGEFVMTAAATGRHRHLLEAMNAGATMPGFARGGAVGGATAGAQQTSAAPGNITIDLRGARGNAEIEALVAEGIRRGLAEYDRYALPLRMRQISADSRRIG